MNQPSCAVCGDPLRMYADWQRPPFYCMNHSGECIIEDCITRQSPIYEYCEHHLQKCEAPDCTIKGRTAFCGSHYECNFCDTLNSVDTRACKCCQYCGEDVDGNEKICSECAEED